MCFWRASAGSLSPCTYPLLLHGGNRPRPFLSSITLGMSLGQICHRKRVVLWEPTSQELQASAEGFVEQFMPSTNWPEPRPVSRDVYRVATESLQDTLGNMVRLGEAEPESDADDGEDPVFFDKAGIRNEQGSGFADRRSL